MGRGRIWARRHAGTCCGGAAAELRERTDELARLITLETGKPIAQARGEIQTTANLFDHFTHLALEAHGESYAISGTYDALVTREPVGVVAAIVPWNFPIMMLAFKPGPGAGRRVYRGLQAGRADKLDRCGGLRDPAAGGRFRRGAQHGLRPGNGRRCGAGRKSSGRPRDLHRLHGCGTRRDARRSGKPDARGIGAWRQIAAPRLRRHSADGRRSGRGVLQRVLQSGRGLRRAGRGCCSSGASTTNFWKSSLQRRKRSPSAIR